MRKINNKKKRWLVLLLSFCMILGALNPYHLLAAGKAVKKNAQKQSDSTNLEQYITFAEISYRTSQDSGWKVVDANTTDIPADAHLKITIRYENADAATLLANEKALVYQIPEIFQNLSVTTNVIQEASGNTIGNILVDEATRQIKLQFLETFLSGNEEENKKVDGSLSFYAYADENKIKQDPKQEITIGSTTIHLNFEEDSNARLGTLELSKSEAVLTEENGTAYLTYSLTAKTADDPMPDVKIVDRFTENAAYIASYVGVNGTETAAAKGQNKEKPYEAAGETKNSTVYLGNVVTAENPIPDPAGTQLTEPGVLVWKIGDMAANETRVLTYRVKLKDSYTGGAGKGTIKNTAKSYAKTYPHKEAESTFSPKAGMTVKKTAGEYQSDENGGYILYQVQIKANEDNSYTLENVKIYDTLTEDGANRTDMALRPYLSYVRDSFKLYKGTKADPEELLPTPPRKGTSSTENPVIVDNKSGVVRKFDYYAGDLQPGEERLLTYKVRIEDGIFTAGNNEVNIKNTASVYSDDSVDGGNHKFAGSSQNKNLGKKVWNRKMMDEVTTQEQTVTISGNQKIYDADLSPITHSGKTFTIPSGSYKYQVVVNEKGDWNVSSSMFKDQLQNTYLTYTGYMRLDYYEDGIGENAQSNADALAQLKSKTPTETSWIQIQGKQSFEFQPNKLLQNQQNGAYLLTYYAMPQNMEDIGKVVSGNRFDLSGTVIGPGGQTLTITGVEVSVSTIIEGVSRFSAQKTGWYFDPTQEEGNWGNGSAYWVIDVSGTQISKGTVLRDFINDSTQGSLHNHKNDSLYGVYYGKLPEGETFTGYYSRIADLQRDTRLQKLTGNKKSGETAPENADYTWSYSGKNADIEMKKDFDLSNGEHLYLVLRTAPVYRVNPRDAKEYYNTLWVKEAKSEGFVEENTVHLLGSGSGTNFKEAMTSYTYDGAEWKVLKKNLSYAPSNANGLLKNELTDPGVYLEWRIKINYVGELQGNVQIEDQLPEGLELSYVRYFWIHSNIRNNPPVTAEIPEYETADGWRKKVLKANMDSSSTQMTCISYYNKQERKIRIDVQNLQSGGAKDEKSLELQVVTKVTDPSVLLDEEDKNFTNLMKVKNDRDSILTDTSASISVQTDSMIKEKSTVSNGKVPFTITVNPLGTDLLEDADTITLVDEMQEPLWFDLDSLKVQKADGTYLTNLSPKIEEVENGQKMILTLPDDQKLTITYEAGINAPPNTTISVNNKAYWFGKSKDVAKIENEKVDYNVESVAGTTSKPEFRVKKADQENTTQVLAGAEFTLTEVVYDEASGNWIEKTGATPMKQTTDAQGIAAFGKGQETLSYNTVYCLQETKAPEGYVLDNSKKYVAIAKKTGSGASESFPEELAQWQEKGVNVYYLGSIYTYPIYNRKGSLLLEKTFLNVNGEPAGEGKIASGTYSFALYEDKGAEIDYAQETQLQVLQIISKQGTLSYKKDDTSVDALEFTGLAVGKGFRVFELDADGVPIQTSNTVYQTLNGQKFRVTFGENTSTIEEDGTAKPIKITNKQEVEIPQTGIYAENKKIYQWIFQAAVIIFCTIFLFGRRRRYGRN